MVSDEVIKERLLALLKGLDAADLETTTGALAGGRAWRPRYANSGA
jgi:hypothetical protein